MSDAANADPLALVALLGGAVAAAALACAATGLLRRRCRAAGRDGGRLRRGGRLPWALRLALAVVVAVVPRDRWSVPASWHEALDGALRRAGVDAEVAPLEWCLLPLPWLIAVVAVAAATPWSFAVSAAGAAIALAAPWLWLRAAIRRRELAVLREMPLHLDLLALALESGATLLLALGTSLPRTPSGPFRDALASLLADLQTGRTRAEAIAALQRRVDFECVQPLTTAMIQAERSGAGLAGLLRLQSEQRSHERFHRAEQLAMQAPVKMLGPLVLCIFPGTFIVLAFVVFARAGG